jgi:DNA gyrase subunit A
MGQRSGLGMVESAVLEALDARGARSNRRFAATARVLADVENRIGLAPGYSYEVLLDLARPWSVPIRLVDRCGNFGSLTDGPAGEFRYTTSRLTPAGEVALAAERGELAPVPIAMINGSTYRAGSRPPFKPGRIAEAIRRVIHQPRVTGKELTAVVGMPDFLTGCTVSGDLDALSAGRLTVLRLHAQVSVTADDRSVLVEHMPPNAARWEVITMLGDQAQRRAEYPGLRSEGLLPIEKVMDISRQGDDRFICVPEPGTSPEFLRDRLMNVEGITTTVPVALPQPLATLIRRWVRAHASEDLLASLTILEDAIHNQPRWY